MKIEFEKASICFVGLVGLTSLSAKAVNSIGKHPHIILIMTDQHRADAIGCAGNRAVITPCIDELANSGHLFTNAYTSAPSSTPARAGLLTGMSPWNHGLLGYGNVAEKYPNEMPQMLRDLGYQTIGIGKMHWNPQNASHGFHTTILDESGRVESPYFMSDYRKWFQTQAIGMNPDSTGLGWNGHAAKAYQLPERLHPTQWTGDVAVDVIENYSSEAPLFLKVSFARPHSPYDPPQRILDKYEGKEMPIPAQGDWCKERAEKIDHPEANPTAAIGHYSAEYVSNSRRHYYAAITFIDEQVGRIVTELKKKGLYDDALICFVSDHGDMMGDHCMWRKTYAYEGSTAIPYIVKLPNGYTEVLQAGDVIDKPVELRDLLPTFLAINGVEKPAEMNGLSLLDLMTSRQPTWRKYIDLEHSTAYWKENYWCALTDGKVKYIRFLTSGAEQLFNLEKDPMELQDLSSVKAYRKTLSEMRQAMVMHLKERGDEWVKDGKLVLRERNLLYGPCYPDIKKVNKL